LKCRKCGHENLDDSEFCQNCGKKLKRKKTGIPILGFRSGNPLKMIIATLFYIFLLIIIAVPLTLLLVNENITTSINSAIYVDQIGNTTPVNGQFMIMNVSVKNNGKGKTSVSPGSFSLSGDGMYSTDSYSWQYNKTEIAPGANTSMLVVFDVEKPDPDELKFNSWWDPLGNVSASIGDIQTIPFNGQYATYEVNDTFSGDKTNYVSTTIKFNEVNSTHIKESRIYNDSRFDISSSRWITYSNGSVIMDYLLLDEEGYFAAYSLLNSQLSEIRDSIDIVDSSGNTVGETSIKESQYVTINGQNIYCWVVVSSTDEYNSTEYYDMTTGLLVKRTFSGTIGGDFTSKYSSVMILTDTNVPLVSVP
jgi:hypothetical protein